MADVSKLRVLMDAYAIAVRAGVMTPNLDDEIYLRELFGLPVVNDAVRADWEKSGGVRRPITLKTSEVSTDE